MPSAKRRKKQGNNKVYFRRHPTDPIILKLKCPACGNYRLGSSLLIAYDSTLVMLERHCPVCKAGWWIKIRNVTEVEYVPIGKD